jgi:type II secretory pathway component PulF
MSGVFVVRALDAQGRKVKKVMRAASESDLHAYLEGTELAVLSVSPARAALLKRKSKISAALTAETLEHLHLIVKSGLPLVSSMNDIADDTDKEGMASALREMAQSVENGASLSTAMENHRGSFGEVVINLVKIGEETGRLDKTLSDAAKHIRRIHEMKNGTARALIYPSFAAFAMFAALIFWLVFVMPKMADAFRSFGVQLPFMTRLLIKVSEAAGAAATPVLLLIVCSAAVFVALRTFSIKFKYITDRLLFRLPLFGKAASNYSFAFFSEYIRLMSASGLPLYQALCIMEETSGNMFIKNKITEIIKDISSGAAFSKAIENTGFYPIMLVRMASVGEKTGHLEDRLENAAGYYFAKVDRAAENITKLIEPVVIGVAGGFMLIMFVALLTPVFNLITSIK